MSMKGKNALITGSARGLGKEMALVLAKEGCNIIINDIEVMNVANIRDIIEIVNEYLQSPDSDFD